MLPARERLDHQPFWCEENVFRLAAHPALAARPRHAVFVSSEDRACPVWAQRAAEAPGQPVVWDYHVVLLVGAPGAVEVLDLDSTLPFPCPLAAYLAGTFPFAGALAPGLEPRFRVIEGARFLAVFASDRSHMRTPGGGWSQPPPPWPPILPPGARPNLLELADPRRPGEGDLVDLAGLWARFGA